MTAAFAGWAISFAVLFVAAVLVGAVAVKRGWLGILIDGRGRYSLSQLQVTLWTLVVLSLIAGVAIARALHGAAGGALGFSIPDELLAAMGISAGSTVSAATIKASKDAAHPETVAASPRRDDARFWQVFLVEEGTLADQVVDVAKFQNFWLTVLLLVAYVSMAISEIRRLAPGDLTALPGFSGTFLTLLGVSHAAYLAGKLPNQQGTPRGPTVATLRAAR